MTVFSENLGGFKRLFEQIIYQINPLGSSDSIK